MQQVEDLRRSVENLVLEAASIRKELRRRTSLLAWLFGAGAIVLACALLAAYTVSLNNQRMIEANNRKWCPIVGLLVPRPGDPPSPSARGLQVAQRAKDLYDQFGCTT